MAKSDSISIYNLAQQLGVSPTTVSRVLNGREGIGEQTRQRVWEAARAAGFRPKLSVRRHTVGIVQDFIMKHQIGSQISNLNASVARALTEKSFSIETFGTSNIDTINDRYLDAVLAVAWETKTLNALRKLSKTIPVIIFNQPEIDEFSSVNANLEQGGRLVAQHLWGNGHRNIGMISDMKSRESESISQGMRNFICSEGGDFSDNNISYSHSRSALAPLKQLTARGLSAVFISNSELTYEIPYLCMEGLNINIPNKLSIIGMDSAPALQFYRPPMTVLEPPIDAMASEGVRLLQKHIENPGQPPEKVLLDQQLILRDSVLSIPAS